MFAHLKSRGISPFSSSMADLVKKAYIGIDHKATIKEGAKKMIDERIGSLIVTVDGKPVGIVTHTDFINKVIAKEIHLTYKIERIMSNNLITIDKDQSIFDGLMLMLSKKIRHLLVVDGEKALGVISEHDWLSFQKSHPVALVESIEIAENIDTLVSLQNEARQLIKNLFEKEGDANSLTQITTLINDHLTCRIIHLSLKQLEKEGKGKPPVSFAWIGMGSEGRRAQTMVTDQDNGLIFADVPKEDFQSVQQWFLDFAKPVVSSLERCGFPLCDGNNMATNPDLCQSLKGWEKLFNQIITKPDPGALLKGSIYFDLRHIYGDSRIVDSLWGKLVDNIQHNRGFLKFYAENMMQLCVPPVKSWSWWAYTWFGKIPGPMDIKIQAMIPLVFSTRILALAHGVTATHSLDRLDGICSKDGISESLCKDLKIAYDRIMLLRIRREFNQSISSKKDPKIIDLKTISPLELHFLQDSLDRIREFQEFVLDAVGGTNDL
ncbi:MAG: CBS domain-containing protein [Proteobacteria bacterium]|nr:CBS domain-containing protein [Pseudomonadota bacterium]